MGSIWVEAFGGLGGVCFSFRISGFLVEESCGLGLGGLRDFSHGKGMDLLSDMKNATELGGG